MGCIAGMIIISPTFVVSVTVLLTALSIDDVAVIAV